MALERVFAPDTFPAPIGAGLTALDLATGAVRWSTNDPHVGDARMSQYRGSL
jgi:hypothetical protein